MILVLPPKRFQDVRNPKYDPIRHRPWFARLDARRNKLTFLKAAHEAWVQGKQQNQAALEYGVDERELRDYSRYVDEYFDEACTKTEQAILDDAYGHYCGDGGKFSIRHHIEVIAPFYGLKARPVVELWETDPNFYPTGYRPFCAKCGEDYAMVKHQNGRWYCHKTHDV